MNLGGHILVVYLFGKLVDYDIFSLRLVIFLWNFLLCPPLRRYGLRAVVRVAQVAQVVQAERGEWAVVLRTPFRLIGRYRHSTAP